MNQILTLKVHKKTNQINDNKSAIDVFNNILCREKFFKWL